MSREEYMESVEKATGIEWVLAREITAGAPLSEQLW
jgi:hypothetical protein